MPTAADAATGTDAATVLDASPHDAAAGDAGVGPSDAGLADAGDGSVSIPMVTVPFDISQYSGITFWGMTTTPNDGGPLSVKIQFPDTDTDPRGGVCNGGFTDGGGDTSKCYDSYASYVSFTNTWQQFTVWLSTDGGSPDGGGLAQDGCGPLATWTPRAVYGVNWQAEDSDGPDAGPETYDLWVDGVYFLK